MAGSLKARRLLADRLRAAGVGWSVLRITRRQSGPEILVCLCQPAYGFLVPDQVLGLPVRLLRT